MKLNYINITTEKDILLINKINIFLIENHYSVKLFNLSFDEKWLWNIIIWFELNDSEEIIEIIKKLNDNFELKKVEDITEFKKQIRYLYNVNCNCKKTLKKISKEPNKIIETEKELIYVFIIKEKNVDVFSQELNNLRLKYSYRLIWLK